MQHRFSHGKVPHIIEISSGQLGAHVLCNFWHNNRNPCIHSILPGYRQAEYCEHGGDTHACFCSDQSEPTFDFNFRKLSDFASPQILGLSHVRVDYKSESQRRDTNTPHDLYGNLCVNLTSTLRIRIPSDSAAPRSASGSSGEGTGPAPFPSSTCGLGNKTKGRKFLLSALCRQDQQRQDRHGIRWVDGCQHG